jgi:hypothetical protein
VKFPGPYWVNKINMHKYEIVSTGNGFWVADQNGENRKQVIKQDGTIDVQTEITFGDGEYVADTNDNELLEFTVTASAVNHLGVVNAATGNSPILRAEGEANTGMIFDNSEGEEMLILNSAATSVNELSITSSATGVAPLLSSTGDDTNIDLRLEPKGTGVTELYSDEAGTTGAGLKLFQDSASPAIGDLVGYQDFYGNDDGGNKTLYARAGAVISSATDGSEEGNYGIFIGGADGAIQNQPNFGIGTSGTQITYEDDGATGPQLSLYHSSSSPAVSDVVGKVYFDGKDDGGNQESYAYISGEIVDPTDGSEDGALAINLADGAGSIGEVGRFVNGGLTTSENIGTAGTSVTAVEYGDGRNHTTVLTISGLAYTVASAAAEAIGKLIYTFPAGAHAHEVTSLNVTLQGGGTVDSDTPDVGIGSTEATGAQATLDAVAATAEDYITGQTATDCSGTAVQALTAATAGYGTGISLNDGGDTKTVHLNMADTWAGADTVTVNGTVVIKWTSMS